MKKALTATLSAALALGFAGCATNIDVPPSANGGNGNPAVVTQSQNEFSEEANANLPSDITVGESGASDAGTEAIASGASGSASDAAIAGTWQTVSVMVNEDGTGAPEHYVQFTDKEINYGRMENGKFVTEYSDKVSLFEKTSTGGFIVQAETSTGSKYTFRTAESDPSIMEYYGTWDEKDFAEEYSGSASLMRPMN
jgi:hypothetical protein